MADPLGAAASIVGIIGFGLQLASVLQTYVELSSEAQESLHDIMFDVNATALALRQLQDVIITDKERAEKTGCPSVFKDAGLVEINALAVKCEKVYKAIVILVRKASNSDARSKAAGGTNNGSAKSDCVSLDPSSIQSLTLLARLKWPWLAPRINRCQEQLRWLKMSLLFNLQLVTLAGLQIKNGGGRQPGAFEEELLVRVAAETLRGRQLKYAKKITQKQTKSVQYYTDDEESSVTSQEEAKETPAPDGPIPQPIQSSMNSSAAPGPSPSVKDVDDVGNKSVHRESQLKTTGFISLNSHIPDGSVEFSTAHETTPSNPITSQLTSISEAKKEAPDEAPTGVASDAVLNVVTETERNETSGIDGQSIGKAEPIPQQEQEHTPEPRLSVLPTPQMQTRLPISAAFRIPSFLTPWYRDLFGREDKFHTDWESTELQAFITREDGQGIHTKVPFGHQRLKHGLDKLRKRQKGTQWAQYLALTTRQRQTVDDVTTSARRLAHHYELTCVAVERLQQQGNPPYILIFFSLSEPPSPIYFLDAVGRNFTFPYQQCRVWEDMKRLIDEAFVHVDRIGAHVREGYFDLLVGDNTIILPSLWSANIKPGMKVKMTMWPMDKMPLRGRSGWQPFIPRGIPPGAVPSHRPPGMGRMIPGELLRMHPGGIPPPTPPGWAGRGAPTGNGPTTIHDQTRAKAKKTPAGHGMLSFLSGDKAAEDSKKGKATAKSDRISFRGPRPRTSHVIEVEETRAEPSANSEEDTLEVTAEEEGELRIVDFNEEAGKAGVGVEELLSRFTNATDTEGPFLSVMTSDSDSSSTGSSSSGSEIVGD